MWDSKEHFPRFNLYSLFGAKFIVEPECAPCCGPLYFSDNTQSPIDVNANGSFGLCDTGEKKLLVTCNHVWEGFLEYRAQKPSAQIYVCSRHPIPFALAAEPIDRSPDLDIVTFDMEPFLGLIGSSRFCRYYPSTPPDIQIGSRIWLVGYPGFMRVPEAVRITFGCAKYAASVTGVDGMEFQADMSGAIHDETALANKDKPPRGISGGPCFWIRESRAAQIAGFVKAIYMDTLIFTSIACINPDGTIRSSV